MLSTSEGLGGSSSSSMARNDESKELLNASPRAEARWPARYLGRRQERGPGIASKRFDSEKTESEQRASEKA